MMHDSVEVSVRITLTGVVHALKLYKHTWLVRDLHSHGENLTSVQTAWQRSASKRSEENGTVAKAEG